MTIGRFNRPEGQWPLNDLSSLREEINRLFGTTGLALEDITQPFLSGWSPAVDVYEDVNNLYVRAEAPGMKKEEIELSLHDGVLTLSGERRPQVVASSTEIKRYRSERYVGRFSRTVSLPSPVVADQVSASYRDGILTVTLPKAEEAKPKQIHVNAD